MMDCLVKDGMGMFTKKTGLRHRRTAASARDIIGNSLENAI
jgi:hypothetical protein